MKPTTNRRELLRTMTAGLAYGLLQADAGGAEATGSDPLLRRGDKLDVAGREAQILEDAFRLGHDYEKRHGGCCRCTVAALQDALPFLPADAGLFRAALCLDGGATPTGIQNCGGFTGAGIVLGYLCGRNRGESSLGDKGLSQELLRKVYRRYEQEYGSVLCKDVRAATKGDCPRVVGDAAKWTAEALLEVFADYRPPAPPAEPAPETPAETKPVGETPPTAGT
jgi:hypothetical protein